MTYTQHAEGMRESILRELDSMTAFLVLEPPFGIDGRPDEKRKQKLCQFVEHLQAMKTLYDLMVVTTSTSNPGYETRDLSIDERKQSAQVDHRLQQLWQLYVIPFLPQAAQS